ncbi:MAG: hypothetical protein AUK03_00205 [Anaerolineae bacterium CG2_30_64_16]|nr:MAG: hypothetical protein AUK03_00205 [Anaerolineae bacterium CG2_30_64_16]
MLVGKWMTRNPITIAADVGIDDALHLMRERKIRRLPVLNAAGQMIGIVSDKDLLHAAPSPATSLSVHELRYLLAKLTVKKVMSSPVITVTPDTPLEQAARIMADSKIGGLPVIEQGRLVGIITETDIFKALLDVLGTRTPGIRVTLAVHEGKGILAALTHDVSAMGANIISLLTSEGELPGERAITFKVNDVDPALLRQALDKLNVKIVDFREA